MLIGELVKRSGLTKDTIRYYEKIGVLDEKVVKRNPENGYKIYDDKAVELLKMLQIGKQHGATLKEIKTVLTAHHNGDLTCQFLEPFMIQKLQEIDLKIAVLQQQRKQVLEAYKTVHQCVNTSTTGRDIATLLFDENK